MPLAEDQQVIQALAAKRAHEPLRESVRPRAPDWRLDHPRPVPGEDLVERCRELAVPGPDQEPEPPGPLTLWGARSLRALRAAAMTSIGCRA